MEKNFEASPPATGGARDLAADLLTDAALGSRGALDPAQRERLEAAARTALTHDHPDVRSAATAALVALDRLTLTDLSAGVVDPSSVVRRRVVEAAVQLIQEALKIPTAGSGTPSTADVADLVQLLAGRLEDESVVAEVAAFGIGELGPDHAAVGAEVVDAAVEGLVEMASNHNDPLCRESAIAALGALHREKATVLAGMDDKATVRRRAILALSPFEGDDVTAAIATALTDRDWQVRQAAEDQQAARSPTAEG